ncbi:MAG: hypothetical protein HUK20_11090, partial [Fibrobacter sp.]|nr:hypothetical protein [Fibrobacter sp.]
MKPAETKKRYVELRALGYSIRKCAAALDTAPTTLKRWERELKDEITEAKAEHLEDIALEYRLTRAARFSAVGDLLKKVRETILKRYNAEADEIPLYKLMEMQIKLEELAIEATAETKQPLTGADILDHFHKIAVGKEPAIESATLEKIREYIEKTETKGETEVKFTLVPEKTREINKQL